MNAAVAWIDGRWGPPADLGVPLSDRGLQLSDGLFETILVEQGGTLLPAIEMRRQQPCFTLLHQDGFKQSVRQL